jgi:lysozyme family protein
MSETSSGIGSINNQFPHVQARFDAVADFTLLPGDDGQAFHITPGDSGGETSYGVTLAFMSDYLGRHATPDDLPKTESDARPIYYQMIWMPMRLDEMPVGVDQMVFDFAVLAGVQQSAKLLQQVVGVSQDGVIGHVTLDAVKTKPLGLLICLLEAFQAAHYASQAAYRKFGNGWLERDARCLVSSIEAAYASAQQKEST